VAPIALGASIYVLWRPTRLRIFAWLAQAGLGDAVMGARESAAELGQRLPDWVLYTLPDALWALALSAAMARIWRTQLRARGAWVWLAMGAVIGAGGEGLQWLGWLPGTADWADALASLVGAGLGLWAGSRPEHMEAMPDEPTSSSPL
jgi:hypothetical protein